MTEELDYIHSAGIHIRNLIITEKTLSRDLDHSEVTIKVWTSNVFSITQTRQKTFVTLTAVTLTIMPEKQAINLS